MNVSSFFTRCCWLLRDIINTIISSRFFFFTKSTKTKTKISSACVERQMMTLSFSRPPLSLLSFLLSLLLLSLFYSCLLKHFVLQKFSPLLPFSLSNFLQGGSQVDGERTGTDDTGERSRPVQQVTFVLVAVRLEFFRCVDRGVFVDVRLAVADAQGVDVASLTVASLRGGTGFGGTLVADTGLATLGFGTL